MRPALLLPLAAALLAPVPARADPPPRVSVRLDYQRGAGAAACPGEDALRTEVARRMGYDPFDGDGAGRLVVLVAWHNDPNPKERRFVANVDRYAASGDQTWNEVFRGSDSCALTIPSLAAEIRAVLLPPPPPEAPAAPAPALPVVQAPSPELPAAAPEPAPVSPQPTPGHGVAFGVAIASYAVALVFAGLGVGYTVAAQNQESATATLSKNVVRIYGVGGCSTGGTAPASQCSALVSDTKTWGTDGAYRNT